MTDWSPANRASARKVPRRTGRRWTFVVVLALGVCVAGCRPRDGVDVQLDAREARVDPTRLEIHAHVSGPQTGLTYKWFSDSGECVPQETDWPGTVYRFSSDALEDRVMVEVWRASQRVAVRDLAVRRERRIAEAAGATPAVSIAITEVPPYEPHGGPDTDARIAGEVGGDFQSEYKVILYARANELWHLQPGPGAQHEVHPDRTWSSATHTGSSYAALLVRRAHMPLLMLDVLPQVGGDVLARTVVEGRRSASSRNSRAAAIPAQKSAVPVALPPSQPLVMTTPSILRIKAGRKDPLTDARGNVWLPDQGFTGGVPAARDDSLTVQNTDTPALFQSERYNVSRFACAMPNGSYVVRLYFAEMYARVRNPGDRVFSFNVEGREFSDFDIFAKAGGRERAYVETVPATISDGELTITFTSRIQYSVIHAIEIIPAAAEEHLP
ncbi:MAG TPA: malectin [Opitutaceae bacterium]